LDSFEVDRGAHATSEFKIIINLTINWKLSLERLRVLVCSNIKATINIDEASSQYISLEGNAPAKVGNSSTIILSTNN
jgi:hypothetical protein